MKLFLALDYVETSFDQHGANYAIETVLEMFRDVAECTELEIHSHGAVLMKLKKGD